MGRTLAAVLALTLGPSPASAPAEAAVPARSGDVSFCSGVKVSRCKYGGDTGAAWVIVTAPGKARAARLGARLLRNAQAVRRAYGVPESVDIRVVKGSACYRGYDVVTPSRACTYEALRRDF